MSVCGHANGQESGSARFERVEVVQLDSTYSAEQLFRSARRWFIDAFKDPEEVIQLEDAAAQTLLANGWFNYHDMGRIWFSLEVVAKAGRYRVRFYDFRHEGVGGITSGATYAPYPSFGTIYDGLECYTPKPNYMIHPGWERDNMLTDCRLILQPLIAKECDKMIANLRRAMDAGSDSDW